jgi:low affinity Fe/Cu permease
VKFGFIAGAPHPCPALPRAVHLRYPWRHAHHSPKNPGWVNGCRGAEGGVVKAEGERRKHGKPRSKIGLAMERASRLVTEWSGSSWAFGMAAGVILVWLLTGPFFHYSDTWQLVINTGTTIVTFLMVFLIQRSQNKESLAVQLKLNEIVAALEGASNRLIDVENLDEHELRQLHLFYRTLSRMAKSDGHLGQSHSVDEAAARHHRKRKIQSKAGVAPGSSAASRAAANLDGAVKPGNS